MEIIQLLKLFVDEERTGVGSRSEKGARVACGEGETVNNFSPYQHAD